MRMADRTLSDQHGLPNIFQQKCPDALRAWASQLVSISQAENVIHALKPMVTSVASSLRTQPEYKPNSVTNRPWDLKNFGWVEEISFTPPKTLYLGGGGLIFLLI